MANILTPGRVQYQVENNFTSSYLRSWSTGVRERYLSLQYYIHTEVQTNKARKNKSVVSCTCMGNKHNFASMFFQFQNKGARLIGKLELVAVSILTFDPVHSFLEVSKISYQTLKVLRLQIFIFCISNYLVYVILCMRRQSNNCIYIEHVHTLNFDC